MDLEEEMKSKSGNIDNKNAQGDYIQGALDAKKIKLNKRPWEDLLILEDL